MNEMTITVSSDNTNWIQYYPGTWITAEPYVGDTITFPSDQITLNHPETYTGTFIYMDEAGTYTPEAVENVMKMMGIEQYKKGEQMEFTFVRQMKM